MNTQKILNTIMYLSVIVVLALWGILLVQNKRLTKINRTLNAAVTNVKMTNALISRAYLETVANDNVTITSSIKGLDNRIYNLHEIIDTTKLVFAFSQSSCNPCIDRELKSIKQLEDMGIPILIIGSFSSYRGLISLLANYNIESDRIAIDYDCQLFSLDRNHIDMCYAIVDNATNVTNFFIPVQNADELSNNYLEKIKYIFL